MKIECTKSEWLHLESALTQVYGSTNTSYFAPKFKAAITDVEGDGKIVFKVDGTFTD